MAKFDLSVGDAEILLKLDSGLVIVRRMKHEWFDGLAGLNDTLFKQRTNKRWGSKFASSWPLERVILRVAEEVIAAGWTMENSVSGVLLVDVRETVGFSDGKPVRRLKIVCDSRIIHAYPVR